MTLDEAIKENKETVVGKHTNLCVRQEAAILLGSEAMKRLNQMRLFEQSFPDPLLPGETKE